MRGFRRLAFVGMAAVAGALGLTGLQQRAIQRTNAEQARQAEGATNPAPQGVPVAQAQRFVCAVQLRRGRDRFSYPGEFVWVGYMRPGAFGANRAGGCWRVSHRGGKRLRGMGVRV